MTAPIASPTRSLRAPRARGAARGFTLVEMMTVVSILAVMLGVLAPSFSGFLASQQAKSLSYDLTSDLMLARNEALKRNASVSISRGGTGWEQGWPSPRSRPPSQLSRRNAAGQAVIVTGAPATIRFDPNGRVSLAAGAVRITISGGPNTAASQLDPSGRARSQTRSVHVRPRLSPRSPRRPAQSGALLIEVLVAVLICAFGLLGFAGMQARAISTDFETLQRSEALVLIEDMVSRMNANRANAGDYVSAGLIGEGPMDDCTGLTGANLDVCEWSNLIRGNAEQRGGSNVGAMLSARGCITRAVTSSDRYVISIAWQGVVPTAAPASPCGLGDDALPDRSAAPDRVVDRLRRAAARRRLGARHLALLIAMTMRNRHPPNAAPAARHDARRADGRPGARPHRRVVAPPRPRPRVDARPGAAAAVDADRERPLCRRAVPRGPAHGRVLRRDLGRRRSLYPARSVQRRAGRLERRTADVPGTGPGLRRRRRPGVPRQPQGGHRRHRRPPRRRRRGRPGDDPVPNTQYYVQYSYCVPDVASPRLLFSTDRVALTLRNRACTGVNSVRSYVSRIYYVADCNRCGIGGDTTPTLKRVDLVGTQLVTTRARRGHRRPALRVRLRRRRRRRPRHLPDAARRARPDRGVVERRLAQGALRHPLARAGDHRQHRDGAGIPARRHRVITTANDGYTRKVYSSASASSTRARRGRRNEAGAARRAARRDADHRPDHAGRAGHAEHSGRSTPAR